MCDLTKKQRQLIRESAPSITAKERELALLKMQREEFQKILSDLLKWKDNENGPH